MSAHPSPPLPLGPLDAERSELLLRVVDGLEPSSLQWLSGFAAGVAYERGGAARSLLPLTAQRRAGVAPAQAESAPPDDRLRLADRQRQAHRRAPRRATPRPPVSPCASTPRAATRSRTSPRSACWSSSMSTHGDGDPPDDARWLHRIPRDRSARRSSSSCRSPCSRSATRATRASARPVARSTSGWRHSAPSVCSTASTATSTTRRSRRRGSSRSSTGAREALGAQRRSPRSRGCARSPAEPQFSREQPFAAEVLANQRITARDATKDVRHIEIYLDGSGLTYEPGDALGVWHENPPAVVDAGARSSAARRRSRRSSSKARSSRCANGCTDQREITRLTRPFLLQHAERAQRRGARRRAASPATRTSCVARSRTCRSSTCCNGIRRRGSPMTFVQALRPLAPRLYSIASSREAVGDEAHLTVAVVDYELDGQRRLGAASAYPGRASQATRREARVFIEHNERFRLPADHVARRDHDRPGHRRRAVPRLPAAPRGAGRHRPQLALLRRAPFRERVPVPARVAGRGQEGPAEPHRPRVLARQARRARTCRTACAKPARTCSPGSRAARTSTSAATRTRWRRTSTRR